MSDLEIEGIDLGGDDSAIDDAFAAAFARAEGVDTEEPTDEEVTPGEEPAAQPRNDLGQFAPHKALDEEPEEPVEETPEEPETDPVLAEYLAKYGNDPEKALKAAANQTDLIGRQGAELGELRSQIEQLRQQVATPPTPQVPITQEVVESLDQLAIENPHQALVQAGNIDPSGQLVRRVMQTWFAVDPMSASAFQTNLAVQQTEERIRAELAPAVETTAQAQSDALFQQAWDLAKANGRADMDARGEEMQKVIAERPVFAAMLQANDDPQTRAQILETIYDLAKPPVASDQVAQAAQAAIAAESKKAKTAARVAKPSVAGSSPGAGETEEPTEEDRIRSGILNADSTDILSGWTTE